MMSSPYVKFIIPDNFEIYVAPDTPIVKDKLILIGGNNSKIISDNQSVIFDIKKQLSVFGVVFEDIDTLDKTNTVENQRIKIKIDDSCEFINVRQGFHITGLGSFKRFEIKNSRFEEFKSVALMECSVQDNTHLKGNEFI